MQDPRDPVNARATTRRRWQLRVLNGPDCGTTYAVEARLSIGRAETSDLQLTAQEVSRHHARIVEDEQGRHVLMDLRSSNGTYVDGALVRRHVLEPHDEITIADVELVYEPVPQASEVAASRRAHDEAMRRAAEQRYAAARSDAPTMPFGIAVPAGAIRDRDGCAVVFEHPDGSIYVGNLLADILEYRTLRAQQLRGGLTEPGPAVAYERLEARLQQPPSTDARLAQRAFCRFGCWLPAQLRLSSGEERLCHVRDVGVDGAQLVVTTRGLALDATVCLTVEVSEAGTRRSIALAGRVAWVDGDYLGLTFAGAPGRDHGRPARRDTEAAVASPVLEDHTGPLRSPPPVPRVVAPRLGARARS